MSGTHVFYNGVLMRDCETTLFDQKIGLDEGRNLLASSWHIKVESTVFGLYSYDYLLDTKAHPSTVVTTNIATDQTATDRMHTIQKRLSQTRKDFFYATHGGKREDANDNIYQILVAATGDDIGTADDPEFFKDERGNDITIRYQDGYHESGGDSGKLVRHNLVDVNNGPIPLNVQITQLFGGRAFRVSFEIEIHRHQCLEQEDVFTKPSGIGDDDNPKSNEFVISNTWSTEETCDESFRRTRAVEGTLRVRDQRYWAQGFRSLCLPGLLPGYRRMSQRFASDPTNLVLKYRVEDKQAEAGPPPECVDWAMSHVDSAKDEYSMVERQLSIRLIGAPRANKENLVGIALNVLEARFQGASSPIDDADKFRETLPIPFIRQGLVITQSSDKPEVELICSLKLHLAGIGAFERATASSSSPLVGIDGYNPDNWPAPRPYDADSPAGIFACYLQTSCSQWHGMPESQRLNLDDDYDTDNLHPVTPETAPNYWEEADYAEYASPVPLTGGLSADISHTSHAFFPYTHIEIDSRYVHNQGKLALPYSIPRDLNPPESTAPPKWATVAVIPVHAGVQKRLITVVATRHGRPPELPEPAEILEDHNGIREELVGNTTIVLDAPHSSTDQSHRVYRVQASYEYVLQSPIPAGGGIYRMANSPNLGSSPEDNFVSGLALFGKGRIEMHRLPGQSPQIAAPILNPGQYPES